MCTTLQPPQIRNITNVCYGNEYFYIPEISWAIVNCLLDLSSQYNRYKEVIIDVIKQNKDDPAPFHTERNPAF